jgi:hypothetical protein
MKKSSHEKLLKTLAKKRAHGIRKQYHGRDGTTRYDAKDKPASWTEAHKNPMKIWVEDAYEEFSAGDNAIALIYKPSSDKERRENLENSRLSFIENATKNEFLVHVLYEIRPKSKPRRLVCVIKNMTTNKVMRIDDL